MFDDILSGSVIVVVLAALFYFFGFLVDFNDNRGSDKNRYVTGFDFLLYYAFIPLIFSLFAYCRLFSFDFLNFILDSSFVGFFVSHHNFFIVLILGFILLFVELLYMILDPLSKSHGVINRFF